MDSTDEARLRRLLEVNQKALEDISESSAAAADTVELDQTRVGRLSRMDALQGQAMAKESERRRVSELARIAAALERLAAGDYGFCLRCDEPIARARLEADPAATLCVGCASKAEV